jgi:hypothetical protein
VDNALLVALVGVERQSRAKTLTSGLRHFSAKALHMTVECTYLAELPHRLSSRELAAVDVH